MGLKCHQFALDHLSGTFCVLWDGRTYLTMVKVEENKDKGAGRQLSDNWGQCSEVQRVDDVISFLKN